MLLRESEASAISFTDLMPFSAMEVGSLPTDFQQFILQNSSNIWQLEEDGNIFMATGIYRPTFVGPSPELWFLLYARAKTRMLEVLRNIHALSLLLHREFPDLQIHVARDFEAGNKFALLMGFVFRQEVGAYNQYRGAK